MAHQVVAPADTLRLLQTIHDTVHVVARDTVIRLAEPHAEASGIFGRLSPFEMFVAVVAIANASYTVYKSFIQRAAIRLYLGEHGSIVLNPGDVGRKLHLPCNFVNEAVKMGVVHHLEAAVRGPHGFSARFRWHVFYKYVEGGQAVQKIADAYPLAVAGHDSHLEFIEFDVVGLPEGQRPPWTAGQYEVEVEGWVNRDDRRRGPNLRARGHLTIGEKKARALRDLQPVQAHALRFAMREWMVLGPHVERVTDGISWPEPDKFPAHQEAADDLERLFDWVERQGEFERMLPRLRARARERDGAIAEIRAAWFLESLGFKVVSWQPAVASHRGDFEVQWSDTPVIQVEVKQPTWESELSEEEKRGPRKKQPRFISGEARWTDTRVEVRRAAEKAMGQISANRPNLLVIVDRLFQSPVEELEPSDLATIFTGGSFTGLGGILCLNANWLKADGSGVDYGALFEANPRAQGATWELPSPAVAALRSVNKSPE